ncbi:CC_3452 family protein [Ponticaulis profundi]|uniref:Uncharacterized protein n=1 Tax=Ponticaulis profundi TaxID=2665222 RepID=A0ABW1SBB6_9PROT
MFRFVSIAIASSLVAMPAIASTQFVAKLKTPVEGKERTTAYKVVWVCENDTCEAYLDRKTATVRVCKKVVKEIGAVSSFGTAEDTLSEDDIASCNEAAK